jgi:hypothetical protein
LTESELPQAPMKSAINAKIPKDLITFSSYP